MWFLCCFIPKTCPECQAETQKYFNSLCLFMCIGCLCCGPCAAYLCCQKQHCQACYTNNYEKRSIAIRRTRLFIDPPIPGSQEGDEKEVAPDQMNDGEAKSMATKTEVDPESTVGMKHSLT